MGFIWGSPAPDSAADRSGIDTDPTAHRIVGRLRERVPKPRHTARRVAMCERAWDAPAVRPEPCLSTADWTWASHEMLCAGRHRRIERRLASLLEFLVLGLQSQNGLIECRDRRPQFGNAPEPLLHESHDDQLEVSRLRRLPLDQLLIERYEFGGCFNRRSVHAGEIATISIPAHTSSRPVNGYGQWKRRLTAIAGPSPCGPSRLRDRDP